MTGFITGGVNRRSVSHRSGYQPGRRLALKLLLIAFTAALAGCAEPFIVLAGDELSGEVTDPPTDWSAFADEEIIQLETQPDDPYSVNIWMVAQGPDLYVATGDDPTNWTRHIDENQDVRVRIRGMIYELAAVRVGDPEEKTRIGMEYVSKYDVDNDTNWVRDGQLFRLDRR
jgi:hypothetical protein